MRGKYIFLTLITSLVQWLACPTSRVVDRGFEPRSGQTKDYEIGMCCFSAKHAALQKKMQRLVGSESE